MARPSAEKLPATTERSVGGERVLLIAAALISVLAPLNSTMIAVALPNLVDDFNASVAASSWLITAYLVVMASVQPLAGKLGDNMGRRNLIIAALVMFGAVSIGASVAPNVWIVLAFRVGQALAISIALSNSVAVLRHLIPYERRGKSFGMVEAVTGLSAAAGPLVGGILVTAMDWRAVFLVNVPFVIVALALAWRVLPRDARSGGLAGFDRVGALLLPLSLVSVSGFFLLLARGSSPLQYGPLGVGSILLIVFLVRYELTHADPVLQPRFYRIRGFAAPSVGVGTSNMAMYSLLLVVPLMLAARGDFSEFEIGLVLTSLFVGTSLLTPVGGRLADRFGRRNPVMAGMSVVAIATLVPAIGGSGIGIVPLAISLGFIGLGLGLSNTGMRVSAIESIPSSHAGSAAGAYSTSRYLGSIIGSAILAGLIGADRANTDGIDQVLIVVTVAGFAAAFSTLRLVSRPEVRD